MAKTDLNLNIKARKKFLLTNKSNFSVYKILIFKLNIFNFLKRKKSVNPFYFKFLFNLFIHQNRFFMQKNDFKKFLQIFQRHGKKHLSYGLFYSSFSLNKIYFNLDFFVNYYYFINLFKLPLNITSRKKGRKLIIIPEVFSPDKLMNVTIHLFYKSLFLYNINFKKYSIKLRTFLELFQSMKNENTFFNEKYTQLMYTFLRNRSWMSFY